MKTLATLVTLFTISTFGLAQGSFSNGINKTLELVIQGKQNHFAAIKGQQIAQKGQVTEFRTTAEIPGAVSTSIIETKAAGKSQAKWSAVLFRSNDFAQAKEKFNEYFQSINNGIIRSGSEKPFILSGNGKDPSANASTSVYFQLLPTIGDVKNLVIELNMQKQGATWRIALNVGEN
jgi:hypothetical protein